MGSYPATPIVTIEDIDFSYNGQPVLEKVSLTILQNDFIGVIGPNGGGKSTLLKLILGLLEPDRGKITVMGGSARKSSAVIGYVPQNVHINNDFPITALDVVLMGKLDPSRRLHQSAAADKAEAFETLARLEMADHAHRKIGELSGGQRQRVLIARALMTHPKLLLLDEPTASIDTRGQKDFYQMLSVLHNDIAILVVSHDLLVISQYIHSVACVNKGLHYHSPEDITGDMLETMYSCSVNDTAGVQLLGKMPEPDSAELITKKESGNGNS